MIFLCYVLFIQEKNVEAPTPGLQQRKAVRTAPRLPLTTGLMQGVAPGDYLRMYYLTESGSIICMKGQGYIRLPWFVEKQSDRKAVPARSAPLFFISFWPRSFKMAPYDNLRIISAGAGSGKTYRLTQELVALLKSGQVRPTGIIATTFTNKAAAELQERVRGALLEEGLYEEAEGITQALIGTVHSLGVKLLRRFAYEAGLSPTVDIIADEDRQTLFNRALATVLTDERVDHMEQLMTRFNMTGGFGAPPDWRQQLRSMIDELRANDFSREDIEKSKERSWTSLQQMLDPVSDRPAEPYDAELTALCKQTIELLENNGDTTKVTAKAIASLKSALQEAEAQKGFHWHQWARISKMATGAKSREDIQPLLDFAADHLDHPGLHRDLKSWIYGMYDLALMAIEEFDRYKRARGLIDYTDMEAQILDLLDHPRVRKVLGEELDLLMVDEFQDTSPIQLAIFLKMSGMTRQAIWVGDPKQSIYGFRGADPQLMQAIIKQLGGVEPEDIQRHSWRSREDIVYACNALFTSAFDQVPSEQVALVPKRRPEPGPDTAPDPPEPLEAAHALQHWQIQFDGGRRLPGSPWAERAMAEMLHEWLEEGVWIKPKEEQQWRLAGPGDVAILCRTNSTCEMVAGALQNAGLQASIARRGLMETAEAKLLMACLRLMLGREDSLAIAELMILAEAFPLEAMIDHRLEHMAAGSSEEEWGRGHPFIEGVKALVPKVAELSTFEMVNLLLEELDLRKYVARMGRSHQRLENIEQFRSLALSYEDSCNRLHLASSLSGFLLWLAGLEGREADQQAVGHDGDSVEVLTYHRSKGLEWPVVICYDLHKLRSPDPWGRQLVSEREEVDLQDVLGGRWLRLWVNPYGSQSGRTRLLERIEESDAMADIQRRWSEENARLLYVGLTRARDYLVFLSRGNDKDKWLNQVWHGGEENTPTLDRDSPDTPWVWEGKSLHKHNIQRLFGPDIPGRESPPERITYYEAQAGKKDFAPIAVEPGEMVPGQDFSCQVSTSIDYGHPLRLSAPTENKRLARMMALYLSAIPGMDRPDQRSLRATEMLQNWGLDETLTKEDVVRNGEAWRSWLYDQFPVNVSWAALPLKWWSGNQLFEDVADLVIDSDEELVLVLNHQLEVRADREAAALAMSGRCWLASQAVSAMFSDKPVRTLVHFPLLASTLELAFSDIENNASV